MSNPQPTIGANKRSEMPWFFLLPSYWGFSTYKHNGRINGEQASLIQSWGAPVIAKYIVLCYKSRKKLDDDVVAEMNEIINKQIDEDGLVVYNLRKNFGSLLSPAKTQALKGIYFTAKKGSVFVLLGHNGVCNICNSGETECYCCL
jgi:hypothetical protein